MSLTYISNDIFGHSSFRASFRARRTLLASIVALAVAASAPPAIAQQADTVLFNGKIATVDRDFSIRQAIAISGERIVATGTNEEMRALARKDARMVDLEGRTVIPGLTDSHMHAIRAALTYSIEVNWTGVRSLADGLARIRDAGARAAPGQWIIVAGGWRDTQFAEKRKPTQAELIAAAPNNPVFVQHLYDWLLLSPMGMEKLGIAREGDVPRNGKLVMAADGKPTGEILGGALVYGALFEKLPRPTFAQEIEGTKQFFRELNRLGLTGLVDPAGVSVFPANYRPLNTLWRDRQLTLRVSYFVSSQNRGKELEDYKTLLQLVPSNFGDDMLRFGGIGEIVTWGAWTNNEITPEVKKSLADVLNWAADNRINMQIHWNPNQTIGHLIDIVEDISKRTSIKELRWWVNHLHDASETNLKKLRDLGIAWSVQDSLYFSGDQYKRIFGVEISRSSPPIASAWRLGLHVAGGTDAHRVSSYNPFVALQWYLDGRSIDGVTTLGEDEHPTREQALRMYTLNAAWLVHAEDRRGSLEPGKYADLAVLTKDYLTVPVGEIGTTESLLTMVGGKTVYAAGPFAAMEKK